MMIVYDMLPLEFSSILVEAVRNKDGNVVKPCIAWCSAEQNPSVMLGNLLERFGPGPTSHKTLFVKYKERVLDIGVPPNIVP